MANTYTRSKKSSKVVAVSSSLVGRAPRRIPERRSLASVMTTTLSLIPCVPYRSIASWRRSTRTVLSFSIAICRSAIDPPLRAYGVHGPALIRAACKPLDAILVALRGSLCKILHLNFLERRACELPRMHLLGSKVNKPPVKAQELSWWHHAWCPPVGDNASWQGELLCR